MKTNLCLLLSVLMTGTIAFAQSTTSATPSTPAAEQAPAQPNEKAESEWKPTRAWTGDLRLRFRDQKFGSADSRFYEQLRARLAYRADIEKNLTGFIRVATGLTSLSANQALGDTGNATAGMSRRPFGLDFGYLEWRPFEGAQIWGGKTPVSFYSPARDQMIFDADLNFEGVSAKYASAPGDFSYFGNLGSSLVSENFVGSGTNSGFDQPDMALLGAQIGASYKWLGTWTADVAYYTWTNAQGRSSAQVAGGTAPGANGRYNGNSTDASANLASKFNILQASIDWQHTWGEITTELFYDFGRNSDSNLGGGSYETGIVIRDGAFALGYGNVFKEADAQLGSFADSDINGGGTDAVGNRVNVTWQTSRNFAMTLTDYIGKRAISTANPLDYNEYQLDLMGTF